MKFLHQFSESSSFMAMLGRDTQKRVISTQSRTRNTIAQHQTTPRGRRRRQGDGLASRGSWIMTRPYVSPSLHELPTGELPSGACLPLGGQTPFDSNSEVLFCTLNHGTEFFFSASSASASWRTNSPALPMGLVSSFVEEQYRTAPAAEGPVMASLAAKKRGERWGVVQLDPKDDATLNLLSGLDIRANIEPRRSRVATSSSTTPSRSTCLTLMQPQGHSSCPCPSRRHGMIRLSRMLKPESRST